MSGFMIPELWCDGKDCSWKFFSDGESTITGLRDTAKSAGWVVRMISNPPHGNLRLRDFCPVCAEEDDE